MNSRSNSHRPYRQQREPDNMRRRENYPPMQRRTISPYGYEDRPREDGRFYAEEDFVPERYSNEGYARPREDYGNRQDYDRPQQRYRPEQENYVRSPSYGRRDEFSDEPVYSQPRRRSEEDLESRFGDKPISQEKQKKRGAQVHRKAQDETSSPVVSAKGVGASTRKVSAMPKKTKVPKATKKKAPTKKKS